MSKIYSLNFDFKNVVNELHFPEILIEKMLKF